MGLCNSIRVGFRRKRTLEPPRSGHPAIEHGKRSAFSLLREGYVRQAALFIEIEPGGSALHVENGTLPALVFGEFRVTPWPQVIPHMPTTQHQSKATARATSTFHTRTAAVDELLADVLNQLLRDLNYAADLNQLRIRAAALAKRLPQP